MYKAVRETGKKLPKPIDKLGYFDKIINSAIKFTLQLMDNTQLEGG